MVFPAFTRSKDRTESVKRYYHSTVHADIITWFHDEQMLSFQVVVRNMTLLQMSENDHNCNDDHIVWQDNSIWDFYMCANWTCEGSHSHLATRRRTLIGE